MRNRSEESGNEGPPLVFKFREGPGYKSLKFKGCPHAMRPLSMSAGRLSPRMCGTSPWLALMIGLFSLSTQPLRKILLTNRGYNI